MNLAYYRCIRMQNTAKKLQKTVKYTIFKTKWGYFGLAANEYGILRTCLPASEVGKIKSNLLQDFHAAKSEKTIFRAAQKQIIAYFEGDCVNFSPDLPLEFDGFSEFALQILTACRNVKFGQTVSYAELAKRANRPAAAARAVGRIMAKNPLPLIIPCHRIVRSDGKLGGFSAPGGIKLKAKLLLHEHRQHLTDISCTTLTKFSSNTDSDSSRPF